MNLFQNRKLFEPGAETTQPRRTADSPRTTTRSSASAELAPRLIANASIGIEEVHQSLRDLHILMNTRRLYHHTHPKSLESLETSYESLQRAAQILNGLEIRVEREALVVPKLIEAPVPDPKGELQSLAADFQLAGIQTLVLLRQFHVANSTR